jgi:hypothetical protein
LDCNCSDSSPQYKLPRVYNSEWVLKISKNCMNERQCLLSLYKQELTNLPWEKRPTPENTLHRAPLVA